MVGEVDGAYKKTRMTQIEHHTALCGCAERKRRGN